MMRFLFVAVVTAVSGAAVGFPPPKAGEKVDLDKSAKETAEVFCQNLTKLDVDALVKAIEFPLLEDGGSKDKAEDLRAELENVPKDEFAKMKVTVKEVVAAEKFVAWGKKLDNPPRILDKEDRLKAMLDRLGKDGRFVALEVEKDGKKEPRLGLILIKFKDDKPWVVGLAE
jgi:hypothetical protein